MQVHKNHTALLGHRAPSLTYKEPQMVELHKFTHLPVNAKTQPDLHNKDFIGWAFLLDIKDRQPRQGRASTGGSTD